MFKLQIACCKFGETNLESYDRQKCLYLFQAIKLNGGGEKSAVSERDGMGCDNRTAGDNGAHFRSVSPRRHSCAKSE